MVTITALEAFNYAGLDRASGESFEASREDAKILTLIGKARLSGVDETHRHFKPIEGFGNQLIPPGPHANIGPEEYLAGAYATVDSAAADPPTSEESDSSEPLTIPTRRRGRQPKSSE